MKPKVSSDFKLAPILIFSSILIASAFEPKTASREKVSTNLCYCVPEFSNLDMAGLPDASDLLKELYDKLDN